MSTAPPTASAFLELFDADPDVAGAKYEQLVVRLRQFFWSRHRSMAEDLAQETLRRGFTRIRAGADIYVDPVHYFFAIARNVAIEQWRAAPPPAAQIVEDLPDQRAVDYASMEAKICVGQCLGRLTPFERELLTRYYGEDEGHEALAKSLGLTHVNLRVMAHRIKRKLAREMKQAIDLTKQRSTAGHSRSK